MLRRILAPLAALALFLVTFGALAAPASAHDKLLTSSPADGETLTTAPTQLVLTFNNEIAAIGAEVQIADPGMTVLNETPIVEGATATATLPDDLIAGVYSVTWRVTSSDGHPIEGTFTFTLDLPAPAQPTTEAPAQPTTEAPAQPTTEPTTEAPAGAAPGAPADDSAQESEPAAQESASTTTTTGSSLGVDLPPWVIGLVGLGIVGSIVALIVRFRRDGSTSRVTPAQPRPKDPAE